MNNTLENLQELSRKIKEAENNVLEIKKKYKNIKWCYGSSNGINGLIEIMKLFCEKQELKNEDVMKDVLYIINSKHEIRRLKSEYKQMKKI